MIKYLAKVESLPEGTEFFLSIQESGEMIEYISPTMRELLGAECDFPWDTEFKDSVEQGYKKVEPKDVVDYIEEEGEYIVISLENPHTNEVLYGADGNGGVYYV